MASSSSSSSSTMSCFQCNDTTTNLGHFTNGWRLRSGDYAHLCPRCAVLSSVGYKPNDRHINRGLNIASAKCERQYPYVTNDSSNYSSAYEEGRFCETFHSNDNGWRDCDSCGKLVHCGCVVSFNTHFLLDFGGVICMDCACHSFLLARKRCLSLEPEIRVGDPDPSEQTLEESNNWHRMVDMELQRGSRNPKSAVTPLFEKKLSASDTDLKLARLIIPKRCAETYFPEVSGLHGLRIKVQDTEGVEWDFRYRYWLNGGSRIYVLEGLRDYIVSKNWQPGDTVMFYRLEPAGKVVMGFRKTSVAQHPSENLA